MLLGDGNGGFAPKTDHSAGSFPASVAVGDFDRDGDPDLATANAQSNDVSVLLGDGAGDSPPRPTTPLAPTPPR